MQCLSAEMPVLVILRVVCQDVRILALTMATHANDAFDCVAYATNNIMVDALYH